ncbi:Rv3654c family TadE-like protein [Enemella evansiae]|uniref:Rv3654c family TadE-like protein n=1 Tax=Enemella evansiae TaxID=2016499 RepID=UPI000B95DEDE|nr:Rv3654c family TadE-like protein [Enemella evansiae]PFG65833.1 secretion/DNA translocation related TadE-like protein [Propionibacteriaceae bacterium ES.041]OYN98708.1 pilus assembly protein TadE [Enemella evansiae]OYN98801.1 pilus assembly protein TadE [Enemella evansiae]OYO03307.1 pilus assembly protein TadE [Enemella evansiae]OYO13879.1 pilus assembly protein TadE [Enemella evansiae]
MNRERGAATLAVAGALLLLLVLTGAGSVIAGYLVAAQRARGAADLAAVSAAARHAAGAPGCPTAQRLAAAQGASVLRCTETGDTIDFVVSVEVAIPVDAPVPGLPTRATGRAHAGRLG